MLYASSRQYRLCGSHRCWLFFLHFNLVYVKYFLDIRVNEIYNILIQTKGDCLMELDELKEKIKKLVDECQLKPALENIYIILKTILKP